jgi:hypothetical protein
MPDFLMRFLNAQGARRWVRICAGPPLPQKGDKDGAPHLCLGEESRTGWTIFVTRLLCEQAAWLGAWDYEQRFDGGGRHDLGEGSGQVAAFGHVDEDAIGGVFGAGGADVQLADGPHDGCGKQKFILDLERCLMNQVGSHRFFHRAVVESLEAEQGSSRALRDLVRSGDMRGGEADSA